VTLPMSKSDGPGRMPGWDEVYAALGVDELIVALAPRTMRSVDRLIQALDLGGRSVSLSHADCENGQP